MNIDELIKELLLNIPKRNTPELRMYIMNLSIMERLNLIRLLHDDNESKLFDILSNQKLDVNSVIRTIKQSDKLINHSDNSIEKLLNNLK